MKKDKASLILGDILALAIVTLAGFVTHGEGSLEHLPRMAAAFLPLVAAWLILAPWFGLYIPLIASDPKMLWRPALAILFSGPVALVLRGLLLNAPIIPIFAVVFTFTSAFGLVVWRAIYVLFIKK